MCPCVCTCMYALHFTERNFHYWSYLTSSHLCILSYLIVLFMIFFLLHFICFSLSNIYHNIWCYLITLGLWYERSVRTCITRSWESGSNKREQENEPNPSTYIIGKRTLRIIILSWLFFFFWICVCYYNVPAVSNRDILPYQLSITK